MQTRIFVTAIAMLSAGLTLVSPGVAAAQTDAQIERVTQSMLEYFDLRTVGDYDQIFSLIPEVQAARIDREAFQARWELELQVGLDYTWFEITDIEWDTDPEGDLPGLYALVSFGGSNETFPVVCGAARWRVGDSGEQPELFWSDLNSIDTTFLAEIAEDELPLWREALGCR